MRWPDHTLQQRFEKHLIPVPETGCWLWTAVISKNGYGQFKVDQTMEQAHRVSWTIYHGEIPENLWVLHKCDVRCCVNPKHLFLGNHNQNMTDMVQKGRSVHRINESNPRAILNKEIATKIREEYLFGTSSQTKLAVKYGITQCHVSRIINGKLWN